MTPRLRWARLDDVVLRSRVLCDDLAHGTGVPTLSREARMLRATHNAIGVCELACLGYLWLCVITRRRDVKLRLAVAVLVGEGIALILGRGCPLGIFQRRAGDDVPMFELWFGPRLAPYAVPTFTVIAAIGLALVLARRTPDDPYCQLMANAE